MIHSTVKELALVAAQLEAISEVLQTEGFDEWAKKVAKDAAAIRQGDRRGCLDFLSKFGGNGSLNDIQVGPEATDVHFQKLCDAARESAKKEIPDFGEQLGRGVRLFVLLALVAASAILITALL